MRDIRVLIVDDHPVVRTGLSAICGDESDLVVVGEAATIAAATALVSSKKPDVAIVDLFLGDEDGMQLVSTLAKASSPTRTLVLSGHDEWLYAERALKAGAGGYIMKDEAADVLCKAVRRVAAGKVYVSSAASERIVEKMAITIDADRSPFDRLSDRERHVFALLGRGRTTREIAETLHLSIKTVETHCAHLKEKLGARNGRELFRMAVGWSARDGK